MDAISQESYYEENLQPDNNRLVYWGFNSDSHENSRPKVIGRSYWLPGKEMIFSIFNSSSLPNNEKIRSFVNHVGAFDSNNVVREEHLNAKQKNLCLLANISEYEIDWDGEGASPIPKDVIDRAMSIIAELKIQPRLFPTGRQSVQMEYELADRSYFEIEIFRDKIACMEVPQRDYSRAVFIDLFPCEINSISQMVEHFYGV